jgi:hypothetical protein
MRWPAWFAYLLIFAAFVAACGISLANIPTTPSVRISLDKADSVRAQAAS